MNIRPATPEDLPAIIQLMKQSLGEALLPKSEAFFRWKHMQNPFGNSYILLAHEGDVLVGLRAFMRWRWCDGASKLEAIRAVDTATHPAHQGKGIFKKLTLQQLELCRAQGINFVFNTPNTQSMPGYLKMGWELQGKMPMKMKIRNPVGMAVSKLFRPKKYAGIKEDPTPAVDWALAPIEAADFPEYDLLHTDYSAEYLRWRYTQCPQYRYTYLTDGESFLLIGRMKLQAFLKEFRILDLFTLNGKRINAKAFSKTLEDYARENKASVVSMSGQQFLQHPGLKAALGPIPVQSIGPNITLRSLNMQDRFLHLLSAQNWAYSTGDLELF